MDTHFFAHVTRDERVSVVCHMLFYERCRRLGAFTFPSWVEWQKDAATSCTSSHSRSSRPKERKWEHPAPATRSVVKVALALCVLSKAIAVLPPPHRFRCARGAPRRGGVVVPRWCRGGGGGGKKGPSVPMAPPSRDGSAAVLPVTEKNRPGRVGWECDAWGRRRRHPASRRWPGGGGGRTGCREERETRQRRDRCRAREKVNARGPRGR